MLEPPSISARTPLESGNRNPGGGWILVRFDVFSSTLENVEFLRDVFFSTLENVEFSRVEEKHNESGMRNPGGGWKGPLVDETKFWQFSHKGHTRKLLCWSRPPFQPGPSWKVGCATPGGMKVGCATPGGVGHSCGSRIIFSTFENVEFSRDVYLFYPRKRRVSRDVYFLILENVEFSRVEEKHNESGMRNPGGLKTSRFHAMYIFSTLENVEFSRDVFWHA